MSVATIIFEDIDLSAGKFRVDVDVKDTSLDDGFASAARVTAMFISKAVATPEFAEGAAAYGQAKNWSIRAADPQTVVLTLTDIDLEAGAFDLVVTEAVDAIDDGSVTPAYMSALFIRDAMHSNEFRIACIEFAHSLIADRPDATVNEPAMKSVAKSNSDQEAA